MTNIVQRLRKSSKLFRPEEHEAADEIERLRHELAGWETKLQTNGYQRQLDDLKGELSALKAKIEALQPVAWHQDKIYVTTGDMSDVYGYVPLYDLGGLK